MNQHDSSDAQIDRARIDGGFSFASATFALGLGLLAVFERIGLPDKLLRIGLIALIFAGLVVVCLFLRTMRPIDFYAGGRRLPGLYAGLAFVGVALGLLLAFLPSSASGIGFASVGAGFGVGCLWALFATGPILRRSGAYSLADLIASRFPHLLVRVPMVLLIGFCAACIALGGYEIALRGFVAATDLDRQLSTIILGSLLVLLIVPAGLSGVVWTAAAATVVTMAALILPLSLDLFSGMPLALPIIGDPAAWTQAATHFAALTGASKQTAFEPSLVIAIGLGLATLAPLFGAAIASKDESAAWRCGFVGMIWLGLGALLIAATLAGATLAIEPAVNGRLPSALPSAIVAASGRGEIAICGVYAREPAALTRACAATDGPAQPLHMRDLKADSTYLLESLPLLRGAEPTLARLAAAFMIVLGMAIAATGLQCLVTALSHDILHPRRRRYAVVSRRLAISRLLTIACSLLASLWLAGRSVDPRALFTLALMLSAALVAPLLALTLMPRPTSLGAFAALCVAAFVTAHFLLFDAAVMPPGELATDAIFAAFDGVAVGLFISFLPKRKAGV